MELSWGFGEGLGVGAVLGTFLSRVILHVWKDINQRSASRKNSVASACDKAYDLNNSLCKDIVAFYCSPFSYENAIKMKVRVADLSTQLSELNRDIECIGKGEFVIPVKLMINFRQYATLKLFEKRTNNYSFTDPLINDIYSSSERIGEAIRECARQIRK